MGLLSWLFPKVYDIRSLSEDELRTLIIFFENGWGLEARHYAGMEGPFDSMTDREIVKGLRKGYLSEDELDMVIALVKVDQERHEDDEVGRTILRKLRHIKEADVLYVG